MTRLAGLERAWQRQAQRLSTSTVAVLLGGTSSEAEVSKRTGAAVLRALHTRPGASALPLPARVVALEIESDGRWTLEGHSASAAATLQRLPRGTLVFLALHGGAGEDGRVQGLLELEGWTHTGSGVAASALCMDKAHTKAVLAAAGLRVARGRPVRADEWRASREALLRELASFAARGLVVKPNRGGSSVDTFVLDDARGLESAVARVLETGDDALVEERIRGHETTCGVLGNARAGARALPPVEIVPKPGRFFDYQEKYNASGATEHCPPQNLSAACCARLEELALAAHRAAGCDGYSRTDFFVPRDAAGAEEEPVVLEINTLPGLTDRSLFPQAAAAAGLGYAEMCLELLALALEREDAERRA